MPVNDLDRLAADLQAKCDADAVSFFGEAVVARWKAPRHVGVMFEPSATAQAAGACDDTITLYLRVADGRITEASFYADGCAASVVCADAAVELALGKPLDQAAAVEATDILALLGSLPKDKHKSARIAAKALKMAVSDYRSRQK